VFGGILWTNVVPLLLYLHRYRDTHNVYVMVYEVKESICAKPLIGVNEHDLIESVVVGVTEQVASGFLQERFAHPKVKVHMQVRTLYSRSLKEYSHANAEVTHHLTVVRWA
jgi:hypothetical protein